MLKGKGVSSGNRENRAALWRSGNVQRRQQKEQWSLSMANVFLPQCVCVFAMAKFAFIF